MSSTIDARVLSDDLRAAARLCRATAADIRAELPEFDGAIDAIPPRTKDGCHEDDATEWDATAERLERLACTLPGREA